MKRWRPIAILAVLVASGPSSALASGVGLTQPARPNVVPASYACSAGQCAGACGAGAACSCGPLGAACVDGATPPACAADGVCTPKSDTFGHYRTNWRRWPGDTDDVRPTPTEATEGDDLLRPFDTPPPEKEDQQAPPPIEDDPGNTSAAEEDELPPLEIDLPPLPEQRPFDAPLPPEEGAPPAPPFGMAPSHGPSMTWQPQSTGGGFREARRLPQLPAQSVLPGEPERPGHERTADRNGDNPPPLPGGFTLNDAAAPPALERPMARFDSAVRQASATGPARAVNGR